MGRWSNEYIRKHIGHGHGRPRSRPARPLTNRHIRPSRTEAGVQNRRTCTASNKTNGKSNKLNHVLIVGKTINLPLCPPRCIQSVLNKAVFVATVLSPSVTKYSSISPHNKTNQEFMKVLFYWFMNSDQIRPRRD